MKSKGKKEKRQTPTAGDSVGRESAFTEFFRNPFFSSRVFEVLLFCFILGLAFICGVLFLSADPPAISWSQDVATDPPQYTNFARNKVLFGDWVMFEPNRFVFFLKSFSSIASLVVFSILGTGRLQANLVAVILNIMTMLFLFLALKNIFGKRVAFFSLFFLATNFVFIMYGRNPFLEISAIFLLTLGFYFLTLSFKRSHLLIPSGICIAGGIFFGKTMAAFILPACLGVLLLWTFEDFSTSKRKINFKPFPLFAGGFILVSVFWLFFSYLPAKREVAGYLGEQALGLYGFPVALQSLSGFFSSLFTFGEDLFHRMPIVFVLSLMGLLLFFRNRHSFGELFRQRDDRSKAVFFMVFWFLSAFFLLMIMNYRPLRYQIYLIPPMCILAGLCLESLISPGSIRKRPSIGILFWLVFIVSMTFFVNYVVIRLHIMYQKPILLTTSVLISLAITLFCGGIYYWRSKASAKKSQADSGAFNSGFRWIVTLVLILISFVVNGKQYVGWASFPTYSLNRASVDLGKVLSPEAVISGPYGPALAWDNRLKDVIHMFGTTQPDSLLFLTYPITHLVMERGGNRDRAFQDYPEMMNNSKVVTTYRVRNLAVDIYRIGEWTGNPKTKAYPLSDFEKAKLLMDEGNADSTLVMLERFVSENPENSSGYGLLAELYFNRGEFEKSALALENAIGFDPTDFLNRQQLGMVYLNLRNQTEDDGYRFLAIEQWEKSLKLFPQNDRLAVQLQRIKGL